MNEEYEIKKRLGDGVTNPFRVPENYFEDFTARMMSRLPAEEETTTKVVSMDSHKRHSKWVSWLTTAAAVLAGVVIGLYIVDNQQQTPAPTTTLTYAAVQSVSEDEYEDVAEYAMIDAGDVYAYLSGF